MKVADFRKSVIEQQDKLYAIRVANRAKIESLKLDNEKHLIEINKLTDILAKKFINKKL